MYDISNTYRTKMLDEVQTHRLVGTVAGTSFTQNDVIGVSYTNTCSNKNVVVGSASIGTFKCTFLRNFLNRGDYYGKVITISDGTKIGDQSYEDVPIGVFYIAEANWTAAGMVSVTAYDCLSLMDIPLKQDQLTGQLYDLCTSIGLVTGVEFGLTRDECEALPNGTTFISPYPENDMTTYRDLVSKLAQVVGGFATATRDGKWVIRAFNNNSIIDVPVTRRQQGSSFSDFTTRFDAISYVDVKDGTGVKYVGNNQGYVMALGENPFLQYGTNSLREARALRIYNAVRTMTYTPFKVSMLPAFIALDLGDVVSFTTDYTEATSTGAIMSISWTYNKQVTVQCFGSNPNLVNAKSKTDNAVAGNYSSEKGSRNVSYVASNAQKITLWAGEIKEVVRTSFTSINGDTVLTLTEIKFTTDNPCTAIVRYVLNGIDVFYMPIETYSEAGTHTLNLMYPLLGLTAGRLNTFKTYLETSANSTIEIMDARQYVQGSGIDFSSNWDGFFDINENIEPLDLNRYLPSLLETVSLTNQQPNRYVYSDTVSPFVPHIMMPTLIDEALLVMDREHFYLVTENGDKLITEDNEHIIT